MRAIIYLRVSTIYQHQSGMGLREQRKVCNEIADRFDIKERYFFKDSAVSGETDINKRPGLLAALKKLKKGDLFIIANRDRLARFPAVINNVERLIKKCKAILVSASDDGTGVPGVKGLETRCIADANAEVFLELIRQKTIAALEVKRTLGQRSGTIPYGLRLVPNSKNLTVCPREQEVIVLVIEWRARGHSLQKITDTLNYKKYRGRTNNPFQVNQVVNILKKNMRPTTGSVHAIRAIPYGYKPAQRSNFEECLQEQEVITCVIKLRAQGYSFREIAHKLNVQGYRSRVGNPFQHNQVVRMLKEPGKKPKRLSHDPKLIETTKKLHSQGYALQAIVNEVNQRGFRGTTGNPLQLTQIVRILAKEG